MVLKTDSLTCRGPHEEPPKKDQRGTNHQQAAVGRGTGVTGSFCQRGSQRTGNLGSHILLLGTEVRWYPYRPGETTEDAREGERSDEEAGGRSVTAQRNTEGCGGGKLVSPAR